MVLIHLLPELILFLGALSILMIDVFFGKKFKNQSRPALITAIILTVVALFAVIHGYDVKVSLFSDMFFVNKFTSYAKIVILILLLGVILLSENFVNIERKISSEFIALAMIATTGSMLLISSNDLLPFYLSLELQSLSLYILAAMKKDSNKSTESGMKYFILGSVSSGILLLGISFVYGFTGSTNFSDIFYLLSKYDHANSLLFPVGLLIGFILVFVAILFKVAAAPFHMWSPDVYQGAPSNVTAFFASVIKFTMILAMVKIYIYLIHSLGNFNHILIFVAVLSLLVGSLGALKQSNIKRMLAYSGIGHVGFIIAGLSAANFESLKAVILYATIYASLSIGAFALLILLVNKTKSEIGEDENNDKIYQISSLAGISKTNPLIALCLAILMFSMAGIPPMAGFFAKFYIILSIVKQELYFLAVIAVLTSVISAVYYLRIIKVMYFDEKDTTIEINSKSTTIYVLSLAALFNLLLITFIKPFLATIAKLFG